MQTKSSAYWILLALMAASLEPVVVKLGFKSGATPIQIIVYRNLFAFLTVLVINRKWVWIGWRNFSLIASVAVLLLLTNAMLIVALNSVDAGIVVTAMTTTPAFVAIVNQMKGRDVLGTRFWMGFSFCLTGVLLTVGVFETSVRPIAIASLFPLAIAVASSTTYRTRMDHLTQIIEPRQISVCIFALNAAVSLILIAPWTNPLPTSSLPMVAWIGVAAAIANFAFLSAIKTIGATRMSIFDMLQRPIVIVIAAFALDEGLTLFQLLGIALVLMGVHFAKVKRRHKN